MQGVLTATASTRFWGHQCARTLSPSSSTASGVRCSSPSFRRCSPPLQICGIPGPQMSPQVNSTLHQRGLKHAWLSL